MPSRAPTPCQRAGCRRLCHGTPRCELHHAPRPSARARGYDADWERLRAQHLAAHPACARCGLAGAAMAVDHKTPHRGHGDPLRLAPGNLQTLCGVKTPGGCGAHSRKTALETRFGD